MIRETNFDPYDAIYLKGVGRKKLPRAHMVANQASPIENSFPAFLFPPFLN